MAKKEGKLLQHLGIVAGICKEIGIAEKLDELVDRPKRKVSVGKATEAMIVNTLGFTGRTLYLTPQFYKGAPMIQRREKKNSLSSSPLPKDFPRTTLRS